MIVPGNSAESSGDNISPAEQTAYLSFADALNRSRDTSLAIAVTVLRGMFVQAGYDIPEQTVRLGDE